MYPSNISPYATVNTSKTPNPQWESTHYAIRQLLKSNWTKHTRDLFPFIQQMLAQFEIIQQGMNYTNQDATHHHGDDTHTAGWAGIGMIPIAIYLYYLKSYGIQGKRKRCKYHSVDQLWTVNKVLILLGIWNNETHMTVSAVNGLVAYMLFFKIIYYSC